MTIVTGGSHGIGTVLTTGIDHILSGGAELGYGRRSRVS